MKKGWRRGKREIAGTGIEVVKQQYRSNTFSERIKWDVVMNLMKKCEVSHKITSIGAKTWDTWFIDQAHLQFIVVYTWKNTNIKQVNLNPFVCRIHIIIVCIGVLFSRRTQIPLKTLRFSQIKAQPILSRCSLQGNNVFCSQLYFFSTSASVSLSLSFKLNSFPNVYLLLVSRYCLCSRYKPGNAFLK